MKRSDPNLHSLLNVCKEPDGSVRQMEWFPSTKIYSDEDLLDEFLEHVLEVKFAFVTDRSSVTDFLGSNHDENDRWIENKVKQHFHVDIQVKTDMIVDILSDLKKALALVKGAPNDS
jgi:hypothetical protein